jgi:hypothetical protein
MQAFLTELLDREILGGPQHNVRSVQEQFWADMSAHLCMNSMSTGLQHLDQLARDTMDATPGTALQGTVLALPAPSSVAAPIPAASVAESAKGKGPRVPRASPPSPLATRPPRSRALPKAQGHENCVAKVHRPAFRDRVEATSRANVTSLHHPSRRRDGRQFQGSGRRSTCH